MLTKTDSIHIHICNNTFRKKSRKKVYKNLKIIRKMKFLLKNLKSYNLHRRHSSE